MSRDVIESVKITIKTEDGVRFDYASKGSAPRGMVDAFRFLPAKRREWVLKHMQAEHDAMLADEAKRREAAQGEQQAPGGGHE